MKGALRLVYPPQCLCCGAPVADEGGLCPACWREADFITGTCCARCGTPLPGDGAGDAGDAAAGLLVCDDCLGLQRPWQQGRAALVYRGSGRRLALMLKHGDRLDLAPALGGWVARAALPLLRPDAVVVPVPVHLRRLLKRKYNQAEMLSQHVARAHGLAHLPGALRRLRHTPMQDHGSVGDRFANVDGAIGVPARMVPRLRGRAVLLVDDVMASGATLAASAQALAAAGAGPISVVVLARAVKDA
ncbi:MULTISPECIES: double zinc ribbon domain-containing protein [Paracoccus]|uniref:double zinc ribbon domain-containing protein n=1 Tax=Paracoccus TaxID=265 RepID=UPI001FB6C7B2|nr:MULTISPECIES: double zinc ribbon domain-containing protein [Paracoccus]MCJ1900819.1 double zinc ribbon domain-containing protein [Paracoccus versutus]MDF3906077.1 double zinc ribbon domain-containing protein [Paracoccus sp. AS002]